MNKIRNSLKLMMIIRYKKVVKIILYSKNLYHLMSKKLDKRNNKNEILWKKSNYQNLNIIKNYKKNKIFMYQILAITVILIITLKMHTQ